MTAALTSPIELVLHPRHGPGLDEALREVDGIDLVAPHTHKETVEIMQDGAKALITFDWDDAFLTPDLRWVQAISAGVDQFPTESLIDNGVVLTSARGVHTSSVAEHALALFLALVRRLAPAIRRAEQREWAPEIGTEIGGMTVTILGMGSIGSQIARLLQPFGASVIGVTRTAKTSDLAREVVGPDGLISACLRSDALICALPETEDTIALVGSAELEALGEGWLINVGRGSSVDEDALTRALRDGDLIGAGLDVTTVEPLPDESPLWELEDLIITPHMGWATNHLTPRLAELVSRNLGAHRGEREWVNRVL